ncbi:hypothetical protein [Planifilum fimeticola]
MDRVLRMLVMGVAIFFLVSCQIPDAEKGNPAEKTGKSSDNAQEVTDPNKPSDAFHALGVSRSGIPDFKARFSKSKVEEGRVLHADVETDETVSVDQAKRFFADLVEKHKDDPDINAIYGRIESKNYIVYNVEYYKDDKTVDDLIEYSLTANGTASRPFILRKRITTPMTGSRSAKLLPKK